MTFREKAGLMLEETIDILRTSQSKAPLSSGGVCWPKPGAQ